MRPEGRIISRAGCIAPRFALRGLSLGKCMDRLKIYTALLAIWLVLAGAVGGVEARGLTSPPAVGEVGGARASPPAHSASIQVTGVSDGDTFYGLLDGQSVRVRLADVDTPEKRQDYGRKAEQALRALLARGEVVVHWRKLDRYGRIVGRVTAGGLDVQGNLVREGWAWVYVAYSRDPGLQAMEREARLARRGLWAGNHPVPPWAWRKQHRDENAGSESAYD